VRTKVFGVLNGLDYEEFNPLTDKIIKVNYGIKTLAKRVENKKDLQREFNLPVDEKIPVIALEGRLDAQKGLDLIREVMPRLLSEYDIQFIVMGGGDNKYREFFAKLEKGFPRKVGTHLMPNFTLPRKIFAGADMLLLPSKYEPGGIVAIEAMRYGAVPVVRATGGLADSVQDFDPAGRSGTGFTFRKFDPWSLFATLIRALEVYKQPQVWRGIQKRAMGMDFSWEKAAERYVDLYERAVDFRRETLSPKPHQAYRKSLPGDF
jgi:starch synthase